MQIHTTGGADEVHASTADEEGPETPLDALLRQISGGYFVLTDGQGSVSKWSEPAELLFGRPAQEVLGQSFFETLIAAPLSPDAASWRGFLESGEAPSAPGTVLLEGRSPDGQAFPLETVFIPVKLDEGFDFSLFLEDLSFELPVNLMLLRMRQQHPVVVRALLQALEDDSQPWDGWRTAGTLVVFRPIAPTPWVEHELAFRETARAEADAEAEERITSIDPGLQGTVNDLDDAAAVVARLLSALERIDDLERLATGLPAQVDEARRDAELSRSRAEAAEREASQLRTDVQEALAGLEQTSADDDPKHLELLARMDRMERARFDEDDARATALTAAEAARSELAKRLERAETDRASADEAIESRVVAAVAEAQQTAQEALEEAGRHADTARTDFEARILDLEKVRSGDAEAQQAELADQLERVRAEHEEAVQAARHQLAETLEGIERERERDAEAARAELRSALERIEHVQRESDGLREELTQMTVERHETEGLAGEDSRRLDELMRDAELARARTDTLRENAEELRTEAAQAREEAAQVRVQLASLQEDSGADLELVKRSQEDIRRGQEELRAGQEEMLGAHEEARLEQEELRAAHEAALHQQEQLHAAHEAALVQQEELRTAHEAALREQEELRDAQSALHRTSEEVERGQQELRGLVEAAHEERDAFRVSTDDALTQLAEVRDALKQHEDSITVQIPADAVEHAELTLRLNQAVGEVRDELAGSLGEVRAEVRTELDARAGETRAEYEALLEQSRGDIGGLVDDARGEIEALRDAEAALRGRLDALNGDGEAVTARLDELAEAADGSRAELSELREEARGAYRAARDVAERVAEIDRGAGNVLADVRAARDRVDEVATLARAAQETAAAGRSDTDELRGAVARLSGELQVARGELERAGEESLGAREAAASAHEAATAAREDAGKVREEAAAMGRELETDGERLTLLGAGVERLGETLSGVAQAAESARTEATAARRTGTELTGLVAEIDQRSTALRGEMAAGRDRLQAIDDAVEALGAATGEVGETAAAAAAGAAEHAAALRGELADVRALAEQSAAGIDAIRTDVKAVRGQAEAMARDAQTARETAKSGEQRLEAMGAEVTFALRSVDELKAGLTSAGQAAVLARREAEQAKKAAMTAGEGKDTVNEVFQQLLGLASGKSPSGVHRRPAQPNLKPDPERREPRHGFDDVSQPLAMLSLDGKFCELNPAFVRLVGYQEHEFAKAAWPSPHDRSVYKQQQEELTQLASGEIESVVVQSTYMHGQGLMVPVEGQITAVVGEDGLPVSLLLEAEERHQS